MRLTVLIASLVAALAATHTAIAAGSPRRDMNAGQEAYTAGRLEDAATAFRSAADAAPASSLDPAPAIYNEASTLFRLGQDDAAAQRYADALRSPDLALQAKAYFNRGNVLSKQGLDAQQTGKTDVALQHITEALGMYENSMLLQPADEDPKVNYELAVQLKKQLEQQKQEQQQQQQDQQKKKDEGKEDQKQQDQQKEQNQQKQQDQQEQQSNDSQQQQKQQDKDEQQQEQPAPGKPSSEEMTPQEARILLDAMRQEEQRDREQLRLTTGQPAPVDKDW